MTTATEHKRTCRKGEAAQHLARRDPSGPGRTASVRGVRFLPDWRMYEGRIEGKARLVTIRNDNDQFRGCSSVVRAGDS